MDSLTRFGQYAKAFEEVFVNDDWTHLEPFFTEDAVYEIPGGPPRSAACTRENRRSSQPSKRQSIPSTGASLPES